MKAAIQHYQNKLAFEIDSADLFQAIETKDHIIIIDTRKNYAFEKEHIPGAINLPHRMMNAETTTGFSKDAIYVTYCDGIGCNGSTNGALKMAKLGFKVKELIGGIEWWKFDGYGTEGTHQKTGQQIECAC